MRRDIIATRRIIKPQVQIVNVLDRRIGIFFKQGKDEEEEEAFSDLEATFKDLRDVEREIFAEEKAEEKAAAEAAVPPSQES